MMSHTPHALFPACNLFESVLKYAAVTLIVLNVPVAGSNTRFFWMLGLHVRRVCRSEWLRVFPKLVFLPVLAHSRDMPGDCKGFLASRQRWKGAREWGTE